LRRDLELILAAKNLLDAPHAEFGAGGASMVSKGAYVELIVDPLNAEPFQKRGLADRGAFCAPRRVRSALARSRRWCLPRRLDPSLAQSEGQASRNIASRRPFCTSLAATSNGRNRVFARGDSPVAASVWSRRRARRELAQIIVGRNVNGRPLSVRKVRAGESIAGLHVLFIGRADGGSPRRDPRAAKGLPAHRYEIRRSLAARERDQLRGGRRQGAFRRRAGPGRSRQPEDQRAPAPPRGAAKVVSRPS